MAQEPTLFVISTAVPPKDEQDAIKRGFNDLIVGRPGIVSAEIIKETNRWTFRVEFDDPRA